ncbi:MAG: hypothetical protein ACM3MD_03945 [Betaproteobacteria bacterium]
MRKKDEDLKNTAARQNFVAQELIVGYSMNMFRSAVNKIIAGILLAYFALFIVPPVSSFASARQADLRDNASSVFREGGHGQETLFLFDIILWRQFKEAKQSEFLAPIINDLLTSKGPAGHPQDFQTILFNTETSSFRLMVMSRHVVPSQRSRFSTIHFLRSGSSPPTLFS